MTHPHTLYSSLVEYPKQHWDETVSNRWVSLCDGLAAYEPPIKAWNLRRDRKWELVSALQKSIRRGDKTVALSLVAAMESMPEDYAYFWRRLCVIACEDVGPADDVLALFTVACCTIFHPKKTGSDNKRLWSFLVEKMCDLPTRSRIYCSFGAVELLSTSRLGKLSDQDEFICKAILDHIGSVYGPSNLFEAWQRKNDWRAEGLLRFVGLRLPFEMARSEAVIPRPEMLFDLPDYCYDMHTRVGLKALQKSVKGVVGADAIREFFRQHRIKNAHRALGEMLFFVEGGRMKGELMYEPLCELEQRMHCQKWGLAWDRWSCLRVLVEKAVRQGVFNRAREEVLTQCYGQEKLQLIATEESTGE